MAIGDIYATGEESPARAVYDWHLYLDGTSDPSPPAEERRIVLEEGDSFPEVKSCRRKAFWIMIWYKL